MLTMRIVPENLSDGSTVYNLEIRDEEKKATISLSCVDGEAAALAFGALENLIVAYCVDSIVPCLLP